MKKEFVKYEQALALKELGFDEPCFGYWKSKNWLIQEKTRTDGYTHADQECSSPLYQQAFRWFREKYGLSGLIEIGTQEFSYQVFNNKGNRQLGTEPLKYNGTYEEAESACLDKLIEIVKNK